MSSKLKPYKLRQKSEAELLYEQIVFAIENRKYYEDRGCYYIDVTIQDDQIYAEVGPMFIHVQGFFGMHPMDSYNDRFGFIIPNDPACAGNEDLLNSLKKRNIDPYKVR